MDFYGIQQGESLEHYGVKGMKWGKHKAKTVKKSEDDIMYEQGRNAEKERPGIMEYQRGMAGIVQQGYRKLYDNNKLSRAGLRHNTKQLNKIRRAATRVINSKSSTNKDMADIRQAKQRGAAANTAKKKKRSIQRRAQLIR